MVESPRSVPVRLRWRRVASHVPAGQLLRFIGVGLWNTAFGYLSFAVLTYVLAARFPRFGYLVAATLSSVLNISVAFLGYKWFVFKSRGSYLQEWMRCMAVYGSGVVLGLMLLPLLVFLLHRAFGMDGGAPYLAGALLVGFNAVYSFFGNKQFTFKDAGEGSHGS